MVQNLFQMKTEPSLGRAYNGPAELKPETGNDLKGKTDLFSSILDQASSRAEQSQPEAQASKPTPTSNSNQDHVLSRQNHHESETGVEMEAGTDDGVNRSRHHERSENHKDVLDEKMQAQWAASLGIPVSVLKLIANEKTAIDKPIAQFMDSLESKLGVSPDRLIGAFKKLSKQDLAASPVQTMLKVVKNLNLSPQAETAAMKAYAKMLSQMEVVNEKLASAFPAVFSSMMKHPEIFAQAMMQMNESQMGALNANKNSSHEVQASAQAGGISANANAEALKALLAKAQNPSQQPQQAQSTHMLAENQFGNQKEAATKTIHEGSRPQTSGSGVDASSAQKSAPSLNGAFASTQTDSQSAGQDQQGQSASGFEKQFALAEAAKNQSVFADASRANQSAMNGQGQVNGQSQLHGHQALPMSQAGLSAYQTQAQAAVRDAFSKKVSSSKNGDTSVSASNMPSASVPQQDVKQDSTLRVVAPQTGIAAQELKLSAHEKNETIKSIVAQTQMLAQKGGGEMRMTLKPDHVGEIQLHVAMNGNHVNVQMETSRNEVKKLIEQNVHELRHGLAQHNLSMDKIDVSLNNQRGNDFSNQRQPDFGTSRDFTQQFQNQQGGHNRGGREVFDDLAQLRSMATGHRQALGARHNSALTHTNARNFTTRANSGRLNLVA